MLSFFEDLHDGYGQSFCIDRLVHYEKTDLQELVIFDNPTYGRVLALDGAVQLTERDHHIYHEMMAHVPLFGHGAVRDVLIIGGGDGGVLREVLRHDGVSVTLVEIDASVIEMTRRYLPMICGDGFDNPRAEIRIADGIAFVASTQRRFDVVIVDSTDPVGPAQALFTEAFHASCKNVLRPGGVLVTQNGVPFFQAGQLAGSMASFRRHFADATCYLAAVPTYTGGPIALGFASDDPGRRGDAEQLAMRYAAAGIATRYYAPEIHVGAFALPPEIRRIIDDVP